MRSTRQSDYITGYLSSDFSSHKRLISTVIIISLIVSLTILIYARLTGGNSDTSTATAKSTLTFEAENIPQLTLGHYALWIESDDQMKFLKRFNANDDLLFSLNSELLEELQIDKLDTNNSADKFIVTIEQEGDRNEESSPIIFLSGEIKDNEAKLDFFDPELLEEIEGSFILATPTDGTGSTNELSGIWFANQEDHSASLKLKTITNEPWTWSARAVESTQKYLSIGDFIAVNTTDNSDKYSQSNQTGYKTPGEDFLRQLPNNRPAPINLSNGKFEIIVSIEPNLNGTDITGDKVFLPVLSKKIAAGTEANQNIEMNPILKLPSLTISIK